jgi:hypothetical protein
MNSLSRETANLHRTHPALYWGVTTVAVLFIALGFNFLLTPNRLGTSDE